MGIDQLATFFGFVDGGTSAVTKPVRGVDLTVQVRRRLSFQPDSQRGRHIDRELMV